MTPTLNWLEIARLVDQLRPALDGKNLFVDRLIVPERPRFPGGYVKGEWALRLASRRDERFLLFSIRPRHPYIALGDGKGPRHAPGATQSPFSLELGKHLKGSRLLAVEAVPRERVVALWFGAEGAREDEERIGLVISLIPATPEAFLVRRNLKQPDERGWAVISRSRGERGEPLRRFTPPDGAKAPSDPPVRAEFLDSPWRFGSAIERALEIEAFTARLTAAQRGIRDLIKQARDRSRQSETAIREAQGEADWQRFGDLLKSALGNPPPLDRSGKLAFREVTDYESGEPVRIPCDPKLAPAAQVEKFYQMARRKGRRIREAETRLAGFQETLARLEKLIAIPPADGDWKAIEALERATGTSLKTPAPGAKEKRSGSGSWLGKTFTSKDGLTILIGRSRDENLELTFRVARGNDVWMHVRGKPGAHAVIPLHSGKSAPLETLLDAAVLTIFYSGGEKWGKTEVDYTFKKHVKRIKDSTEASYTNNKTLIVEPGGERLKRLLSQNA
jgi:predicted ribosome quality control (RQC) complex YloA/Tae2 family protein